MNAAGLEALVDEWRAEAEILRHRGAPAQADVLDGVAAELSAALRSWMVEELTIAGAARESGYSEDHLRELVRSGRLPDNRTTGSEGRIHIRRCDLPRKLPQRSPTEDVVDAMATELAR